MAWIVSRYWVFLLLALPPCRLPPFYSPVSNMLLLIFLPLATVLKETRLIMCQVCGLKNQIPPPPFFFFDLAEDEEINSQVGWRPHARFLGGFQIHYLVEKVKSLEGWNQI